MGTFPGDEAPLTVLVVDDDADEILLIREDLEAQARPIRVGATAGSLAQADAAIEQGHFDAVILDLTLPDARGSESVRHMAERHPSLPIVVLTGNESLEVARDVLSAGAQDYLLKGEHTSRSLARAIEYAVTRQRLEKNVQWGKRMEALGRFAAGIAHDFNNVLSIVNGYAELALAGLDAGDSRPMRRELTMIRNAGQRAAGFTRRLLAFSRTQILQPVAVDLSAIVRDCEEMLRHVIGEHISLETRAAPDLPRVLIDVDQLHDAILNLCINAKDAMPGGGTLTIATGRKHVDEASVVQNPELQPGDHVVLSVSDTGCGMDEETLARIFEPFFTTKPAGKGTGLGLPSVYGVVRQSGGHVAVYSEPGFGTTFRAYLPASESGLEEIEEEPEFEMELDGSETVLLVEDEEVVRDVAFDILRMYGYNVLVAEHVREAIEIARRYHSTIHLLLTDVVMPEMCGPDVADEIRRYHAETRVLYMSGYAADAMENKRILEHGAAFLEKPFTPEEMARKVRGVLSPRRSVRV